MLVNNQEIRIPTWYEAIRRFSPDLSDVDCHEILFGYTAWPCTTDTVFIMQQIREFFDKPIYGNASL